MVLVVMEGSGCLLGGGCREIMQGTFGIMASVVHVSRLKDGSTPISFWTMMDQRT